MQPKQSQRLSVKKALGSQLTMEPKNLSLHMEQVLNAPLLVINLSWEQAQMLNVSLLKSGLSEAQWDLNNKENALSA